MERLDLQTARPVHANEHVARNLKPALLVLAAYYLFLAGESLLIWSSSSRAPVTSAASLAALTLLLLAGVGRVPKLHFHRPYLAGLLAVAVVSGHTLFELSADPGAARFERIAFGILGAGLVYTSPLGLAAVVAFMFGILSLGALLMPSVSMPENALLSLAAAVVLAFVIQRVRQRSLSSLEVLTREAEEQRLAREKADERYRLAVEGASDGIYDWDLANGTVYYSPRWAAIVGQRPDTVSDSPNEWLDRVHPDDLPRVQESFERAWSGGIELLEEEYRIRCSDTEYRWVLTRGVCLRGEDGTALRMAGSVTDMSARGLFDVLTGLPNRRLLLDRLERAMVGGQRDEREFAVLFVDLDRFKMVNDTLGHHVGDEILVEAAARLQTCVRASDTVARLGGDEFVVLLERVDVPHGVEVTIERILKQIAQPIRVAGRELFLNASIGAVVDTRHYEEAQDLIRDADTAMYEAKGTRERWVVFDVEMRERMAERLRLESELHGAIEREEFLVHYQPIVDINTGELVAFEALVRWEHPEQGLIPPDRFIPLMEDTGSIVELGRWVLRRACQEMQDRYPGAAGEAPSVSVNLSRLQLRPELLQEVQAVLDETGFDPRRLKLEVTETAILEQAQLAIDTLTSIKELGIQIMMDDFGTGHSSLGVLQLLPIDQLKIDRSFIDRVGRDANGTELVRAIIAMSQTLGLEVVAEGIETAEQLQSLRDFSCDLGQGFLFARPNLLDELPDISRKTSDGHTELKVRSPA